MDTSAYLTNQGWRGDGHALHISGRGIVKPLRVSQKLNTLGVGKKKHDAHADQWLARAFDDTLKGLNATTDSSTGNTEGLRLGNGAQALRMAGKAGAKWVGQQGLYGSFVKGESLQGTLPPKDETLEMDCVQKRTGSVTEEMRPVLKKARAVEDEHPQEEIRNPETKQKRRLRRQERRAKKALRANQLPEQPHRRVEKASGTAKFDRSQQKKEKQLLFSDQGTAGEQASKRKPKRKSKKAEISEHG